MNRIPTWSLIAVGFFLLTLGASVLEPPGYLTGPVLFFVGVALLAMALARHVRIVRR